MHYIPTPFPPAGGNRKSFKKIGCPGVIGSTPSTHYVTRFGRALWMRENQTPAEALLWEQLKGSALGVKFRRQQLIHFYIVDFYCVQLALVIEIDGNIHLQQEEYDRDRERTLLDSGCSIVRFTNDEILSHLPRSIQSLRDIISSQSPLQGI